MTVEEKVRTHQKVFEKPLLRNENWLCRRSETRIYTEVILQYLAVTTPLFLNREIGLSGAAFSIEFIIDPRFRSKREKKSLNIYDK